MRIAKLDLKAFRSFQQVALATDAPRVLIAGVNATGKTSVREAIKWVLTGRCEGLDGKGSGAEVLTPAGSADGAAVTVELAGIGAVRRTAKNGSSGFAVQGFSGTGPTQQAALLAKLATTPAMLDAVLETDQFLALHHADAKALVLALLDVRITLGEEATYSLAELDDLYAQAYEDRKLAKRLVQQTLVPARPAEDAQPTVTAVEDQLTRLRGELERLSLSVGTTVGQRQMLLKRQATVAVRPPAPRWTDADADRLLEVEERLAMLEAEGETPPGPAPSASGPDEVTFLRNRAEAIGAHKPTKGCVFDESIPCKTPKAEFARVARSIQAELATRDDTLTTPTAPPNPLTAVRQELKSLQAQQTAWTQWQTADQRRTQELQSLETELAALEDTTTHETQIATLKARIAKGQEILRQAQAHWAAVKAAEDAEATREARRADLERLETLCETLGPNGVRVQALQAAIGRFETLVNTYTAPFGWRVQFGLEPWAVHVNERPVETYSKSEQFRIGIALQIAIAALSGIGFAVIDELDMLDIQNRGLVTQMVLQAPLEQVFVLGTRELGVPLPQSPDVLAYRLAQREGQSVVVEQSGGTSLAA